MDRVHRGRVYGDIVDTTGALVAGWFSMPWLVKDLMSVRLELVTLVSQPDAVVGVVRLEDGPAGAENQFGDSVIVLGGDAVSPNASPPMGRPTAADGQLLGA